jgi:GNAT superfamily N-acetyltransferase
VKTMEPTQSSDELRERRDMNPAHMNAFLSALVTGKKKYFQDVYGPNFMHLRILGTLPAYRGRKAGSTLVRWGLDLARTHGMPTSLFASPMGGVVYKHLGFKPVGELVVQAEGEEEKLFYDAMVYEFEK